MITVGQPTTILPPWLVGSPMRAAGELPISTVSSPRATLSGPSAQTS
jgi:hypothetical protein